MSIVNKILTEAEIAILKTQARAEFLAFQKELRAQDCGFELAQHINPRIIEHRNNFNSIMDKLAKLDIAAPPTRL